MLIAAVGPAIPPAGRPVHGSAAAPPPGWSPPWAGLPPHAVVAIAATLLVAVIQALPASGSAGPWHRGSGSDSASAMVTSDSPRMRAGG